MGTVKKRERTNLLSIAGVHAGLQGLSQSEKYTEKNGGHFHFAARKVTKTHKHTQQHGAD